MNSIERDKANAAFNKAVKGSASFLHSHVKEAAGLCEEISNYLDIIRGNWPEIKVDESSVSIDMNILFPFKGGKSILLHADPNPKVQQAATALEIVFSSHGSIFLYDRTDLDSQKFNYLPKNAEGEINFLGELKENVLSRLLGLIPQVSPQIGGYMIEGVVRLAQKEGEPVYRAEGPKLIVGLR